MAGVRKKEPPPVEVKHAGVMADIALVSIRAPRLPARETMDSDKMTDLCESLAAIGLQQPIILAECESGYEIIAGHRRYLAARQLNWATIRAIVYPAGFADATAVMIHENVVREDLNAGQEAVFYAQLIEERQLDEAGICALVKRSPDYIAVRLGLLRGNQEVFAAVRDEKISLQAAKALNKITDDNMCRYYLDAAIRGGTPARVVETWVTDWKAQQGPPGGAPNVEVIQQPAPSAADPFRPACMLCGGTLDPWNLVNVMIHKFELAEIQRVLDIRREDQERAAGVLGEGEGANGAKA